MEIDARHELRPAELSQTGLRQFRKLLDDLNLRVAAVAFPTRRGYDEPPELERRILATAEAMKLAYQLGAGVVTNRVTHGGVTAPGDPRFDRLLQSLTALGACGEKYGARLAAKTGGESGPELAVLLEQLPEGSIGVDLDPGGLIAGGQSVEDALDSLGRRVIHVHATDAIRDLSVGRAVEVELGRGTADLPALLGQLEEFTYRGWVTIERHDSADPVGEIGNAVAYLRSV